MRFILSYRKGLGAQKKVNRELRDMFNLSAIFDVEFLTKVLMVVSFNLHYPTVNEFLPFSLFEKEVE